MIRLMNYKFLFFTLSLLLILPGLYFLLTSGLKLGIDFTGGALLEYQFINQESTESATINLSEDQRQEKLQQFGVVTKSGEDTFIIRTKEVTQEELASLKQQIASSAGVFNVQREENVGPVIGEELKRKAFIAITAASLAIIGYIALAFRKVPKPTSSWRFAVTSIIALLHDVLIIVGLFAILGHFFNVEIDVLFVTALLTIIGFSIHDTIVVLDRIRENLPKMLGRKFAEVADVSITQTIARSINTSLTVVFVLIALLLFGGESIRWFVVALLAGITIGTYSSIFIASGLLTLWEEKLGH